MSSDNVHNYIFIDESGDPGRPFRKNAQGAKVPSGASMFYILTGVFVNSKQMFALQNRILEIRQKYNYQSEIKSTTIPLPMYKDLLNIVNELGLNVSYRLVDKTRYKGKFAIDGDRKLHNVFDEYNLAKLCNVSIKRHELLGVDVVIDRADRRLLDGDFESFNIYLKNKVNTKTLKRIEFVTHVDSEYVNAIQLSDLLSGAIKDYFTGKNKELKKVIRSKYLYKIY